MGLLDTLEDDKKKLAELTEEPEEELVEEVEEEAEEPEPEEEKPEEPVVEKEPELDASGHARLRREKAAEKRRADELERELLTLRNAQVQQPIAEVKPQADPKPDVNVDPVGYAQWLERKFDRELGEVKNQSTRSTQATEAENLQRAAIQEFTSFERKFASKTADYNPVVEHFNKELATSIKRLNRHFTDEQVANETTRQALLIASDFAAQGLDPAEEMYHLTKEQYGYKEPVAEAEALKPDLKKVGANRQRNAGTGAARGVGEGTLTGSTVMKMSNAEFAKLSPEQKARVIESAR